MRRLSRSSRTSTDSNDVEKRVAFRLSRGSRSSFEDSRSAPSARTAARRGCTRSSAICGGGLGVLASIAWLLRVIPHGSHTSILSRTDMDSKDAALVTSIYRAEIGSIRTSKDVPPVVTSLRRRLSSSLGGQWDVYTTDGGMMSYSLPCVQFVEFTSPRDTWVALLCQTTSRLSSAWAPSVIRCAQLGARADGTLSLERLGKEEGAVRAGKTSLAALRPVASAEEEGGVTTDVTTGALSNGLHKTREPAIQLVASVLASMPQPTKVHTRLALDVHVAIEEADKAAGMYMHASHSATAAPCLTQRIHSAPCPMPVPLPYASHSAHLTYALSTHSALADVTYTPQARE